MTISSLSTRLQLRWAATVEQLRASLWSVPAVFVSLSVGAGAWLNGVEIGEGGLLSGLLFPGGADSARAILQTIAGSVITVTGVVFSLTVVTLQLASTQFSPRLLRTFLRDVSNQVVLGTFLGTFAFCLIALRGVASATPDEPEVVPTAAITAALVLAATSVVALVFFIDHIARSIRIDSLMREVNEDTAAVIAHVEATEPASVPAPSDSDVPVVAPRSGFVQAVDEGRLVAAATTAGALVYLEAAIGDRVIQDSPMAWLRLAPGTSVASLERVVHRSIQVGYERTVQQDVAFGIRQLVDVAVKALSPGVNDPTTAVHAIAHLAHLLTRLAAVGPGYRYNRDSDGVVRVVVPGLSFGEYLALSCDQIRRYGAAEPEITVALLRLVRDVARVDHPAAHGAVIRRQVDLITVAAEHQTSEPRDLEPLHTLRNEIHEIVRAAERRSQSTR